MKKYISMLLAACLILGMTCVPVRAAESGTCGENLTWTLSDEGVVTVSGTGDMEDFYLEAGPWGEFEDSITKVVIEEGVTSIGDHAFYSLGKLETVVIADSVTRIGADAFQGCQKMTSIRLPKNLRVINDDTFVSCTSLKEVELPKNLEYIGRTAFFNCSALTKITIPGSVTAIDSKAFAQCYMLNSITFAGAAPLIEETTFGSVTAGVYYREDNGTWNEENRIDYSGNLTWIPYSESGVAGEGTCGKKLNWKLSDGVLTVTGSGAMDVFSSEMLPPWYAIRGQIRQVILPEGLTQITDYAFCNCSALEAVAIPSTVTSIGSYAFYGCPKLKTVTFSGDAPAISAQAFSGITLTIRYNGQHAGWEEAKAGSYEGGLTWTDYRVSCEEHSFGEYIQTVAPTCTSAGLQVSNCTLCDATQSREIEPLGHSFTTQTVTPGCETNGYDVSECTVCAEYHMHNYVPALGHSWDEGEKVSAVLTRHTCATCGSRWDVQVTDGTCGTGVKWAFDGYTGLLTISGSGKMKDYTGSDKTPWAAYSDLITAVAVESGVTYVGAYAFAELPKLSQTVIADTVSAFGTRVFYRSEAMRTVQLPEELTELSDGMFYQCRKLHTVDIPDTVTRIGEDAFNYCEGLKNVAIPAGVTEIGESAFYNCGNITSITVPAGVTEIRDYAFGSCQSLTELKLHDGITSIGRNGFANCVSLQSITLPANLTTIGRAAFFNCQSLASITIPETVTSMGNTAFFSCYGLGMVEFLGDLPTSTEAWTNVFKDVTTTVFYPAGNETWTEDAMQDYGGNVTWKAACPEHSWSEWETVESGNTNFPNWLERSCTVCGHIETKQITEPEYHVGDVNHDGVVDGADAMLLRQFVARWKLEVFYPENADLDGSGIIDGADAMLLRQLIA